MVVDLAFQTGVIGMRAMLFAQPPIVLRFFFGRFLIFLQATECLVSCFERRKGIVQVTLALLESMVGMFARRVQTQGPPADRFARCHSCITEGAFDRGAVDDLLLDVGHHFS